MTSSVWNSSFFAECAAKLAQLEKKFSNTQLEYLRHYYIMNKYPKWPELEAIAKQWNMNDFDVFLDLDDWFSGRRMAEHEISQRRDAARKAAA